MQLLRICHVVRFGLPTARTVDRPVHFRFSVAASCDACVGTCFAPTHAQSTTQRMKIKLKIYACSCASTAESSRSCSVEKSRSRKFFLKHPRSTVRPNMRAAVAAPPLRSLPQRFEIALFYTPQNATSRLRCVAQVALASHDHHYCQEDYGVPNQTTRVHCTSCPRG